MSLVKNIINRLILFKGEILWILMGQMGVALGGIFSVKILTQVLGADEFGKLALANTVILLIGTNFFGPIGQGFMRFWSISQERNEIGDLVVMSRRYIYILICFALILCLIVSAVILYLKKTQWVLLIVFSMIVGILSGWSRVRLSILAAARKRKIVALIDTGTAFAKPLIGAMLVILFIADADYVLTGYIAVLCLSTVMSERYFKKIVSEKTVESIPEKKKNHSAAKLGQEIIAFSRPFYIWGLFAWIHQSCDRWAVQAFHGSEAVGAFFVISQLALYPLVVGSNFLTTFCIPIAYEKAGGLKSGASMKAAHRVIALMTAMYVFGTLMLIFFYMNFHNYLVLLVSNEIFVEFSSLLPGLTCAWGFYYLGQTLSGFGLIANKPALYMPPIIFSGITAAFLTFILSKKFGMAGVVWGLGIAGFIYALWFMIIAFGLSKLLSEREKTC